MNRKMAIRAFLTILAVTIAVGAFTYIIVQNKKLEETLHENEKTLSETRATLNETVLQVEAMEKLNKNVLFQKDELAKRVKELNDNVSQLATANKTLDAANKKLKADYETLKKNKAIAAEKAKQQTRSQLANAGKDKEYVAVSRSNNQTATKTFYVTATAYTAYCAGCSGITATGLNLRANPAMKVIAVDPRVIPLGSKVWVEGYGNAIAGDTGGAIKGNKVDLFMASESSARQWGRKKVQIKIF